MAVRHDKCYEKNVVMYFLFARDDGKMTSGWQGAPYFRSLFQHRRFSKFNVGGATVQRRAFRAAEVEETR